MLAVTVPPAAQHTAIVAARETLDRAMLRHCHICWDMVSRHFATVRVGIVLLNLFRRELS
jgi:hypothetical protein